jgi:hypothetical protein
MDELSKWKLLGEFISERFRKPFKHPEFIFYFILIIVGFGSIGIFTSIFSEFTTNVKERNIINSMSSYFLAIVSTGAVELLFIKDKIIKNAVLLMSLAFLALCILFLLITFNIDITSAFLISGLGIILAWFVWWIANAENANLCDDSLFTKMSTKSKQLNENLDTYDQ